MLLIIRKKVFFLLLLIPIIETIFVVAVDDYCWNSTRQIYANELKRNNNNTTDELVYTYIICPDTTFQPGIYDLQTTKFEDNKLPLIVYNSNSRIQCGNNNCIIEGTGTFGMIIDIDDSDSMTTKSTIEIVGLRFIGFNFEDSEIQNMITYRSASRSSNIIFKDCIFEFSSSKPLLEFTQIIIKEQQIQNNNNNNKIRKKSNYDHNQEINISIIGCHFRNMRIISNTTDHNNEGLSLLQFSGLNTTATNMNVVIKQTIFENINTISKYDKDQLHRSIIDFDSIGKLILEDLCFYNIKMKNNNNPISNLVIANENATIITKKLRSIYIDDITKNYDEEKKEENECSSFVSLIKKNKEGIYEKTNCGPVVADATYCFLDNSAPDDE